MPVTANAYCKYARVSSADVRVDQYRDLPMINRWRVITGRALARSTRESQTLGKFPASDRSRNQIEISIFSFFQFAESSLSIDRECPRSKESNSARRREL